MDGQPVLLRYVNQAVDPGLLAMLRTELVPWLDAHPPLSAAYRQWMAEDERQPRFNTDAADGHGSGW